MSDSLRRGLRTLLDALLAVLAAGVVDAYLVDMDPTQRGALAVALTGVISVIKNALEDSGKIPAVLKAPASDGADPVPDSGHADPGLLVGLIVGSLGTLLLLWLTGHLAG